MDDADAIFVGTATDRAGRRHDSGLIVTDVTFSVEQAVKGKLGSTVSLMHLGGSVGDETLSVAGFPVVEVGQRYIVFLRENGSSILPLAGGDQGLILVVGTKDARATSPGANAVPGALGPIVLDAMEADNILRTIRRMLGRP